MSSNSAELHRFARTAMFICGGLLIWAADFLLVYVFAALACAKRFANLTIAGLPVVSAFGLTATLLAAVATGMLMRVALQRSRRTPDADASVRFIHFLAIAIGGVAVLAIAFNALPALLLAKDCAT